MTLRDGETEAEHAKRIDRETVDYLKRIKQHYDNKAIYEVALTGWIVREKLSRKQVLDENGELKEPWSTDFTQFMEDALDWYAESLVGYDY